MNVNLDAGLGAIGFLAACFVMLAALLVFVYSLVVQEAGLAKLVLLLAACTGCLYLGLMLAFSLKSSERVLARGQEKHFCEIDCHLAYSVIDVRQVKTLGSPPNQATARGVFNVVTVRARFDEQTILPTRGNEPLTPNSRILTVFDQEGRTYGPSAEGQRALDQEGAGGMPLTTPLRPGEAYTSTLVFDLPADASHPKLLINEGEWMTHLLIGHENSILHQKTKFSLDQQQQSALSANDNSKWTRLLNVAAKGEAIACAVSLCGRCLNLFQTRNSFEMRRVG